MCIECKLPSKLNLFGARALSICWQKPQEHRIQCAQYRSFSKSYRRDSEGKCQWWQIGQHRNNVNLHATPTPHPNSVPLDPPRSSFHLVMACLKKTNTCKELLAACLKIRYGCWWPVYINAAWMPVACLNTSGILAVCLRWQAHPKSCSEFAIQCVGQHIDEFQSHLVGELTKGHMLLRIEAFVPATCS